MFSLAWLPPNPLNLFSLPSSNSHRQKINCFHDNDHHCHDCRHTSQSSSLTTACAKHVHHDRNNYSKDNISKDKISRRIFAIRSMNLYISSVLSPANAEKVTPLSPSTPSSSDLISRLSMRAPGLPKRTRDNPLKSFPRDLYYPFLFSGSWSVKSTLISVLAPAGLKCFGRHGAYDDAVKTIGDALEYPARFIRSNGGVGGLTMIADRGYNVHSIADSAMGEKAVLSCNVGKTGDVSLSVIVNGFVCDVGLYVMSRNQEDVNDMRVLGRAQRQDGSDVWNRVGNEWVKGVVMSETVRQTVRRSGDEFMREMPLVKDVETTTAYVLNDGANEDVKDIKAFQRTCTYLTREDAHYVDARGRPVDVRWYELHYSR